MTIAYTNITTAWARPATSGELVNTMYKQWQMQGNCERTNKNVKDDGHEIALPYDKDKYI